MAASVANYMSGNGIPYIAPWDGTTPPGELDWVDLGDINKFSVQPKVTKKDHWSHRTGIQARDLRVKVKEECTLTWELTEITSANLLLYFQATLSGSDVLIMEGGVTNYAVKFEQVLINGIEHIFTFWKADVIPGAAIELIADGTGEGDWAKLEIQAELLEDSTNHPTNKWGKIALAPTV